MKTFSLLSILVLSSVISMAQPRRSPEVRAEKETQWMKDSLGVTATQADKVHSIALSYHQKMDKVATSKTKTRQQKKLMSQKDASIKKLLSKEQFDRYCAHEKQVRLVEKQRDNTTGNQPY
jgi:Spy/CpxP family protein refolding chaperone